MADEAQILGASDEDVAYFARRRCRDEHARTLYLHLAQSAPYGAFVARDAGTPIGIAIPHALEDEWYVSEVFVEPSFRSRGIGSQLLAEASSEAGDISRSAVFESGEAASAAFVLQRGVALQTPVLEFSGAIPHENELARMAGGTYRFLTEPLDPRVHRAALSQLDREVRGSARPADHVFFAQHACGVIFRRDEELAGYAYVWPSGRIGPFAAASGAYSVQFLAFALATLRQTYDAAWCTALVPGTNVRIARAALRAGLRIEGAHTFASDNALLDLSRYVGFQTLLF